MAEYASEAAIAINRLADAMEQLAAVFAWGVVEMHSDTHGRQAQMAAVVLRFAKEGYFTQRVDGVNVSRASLEQGEAMMRKLWPDVDLSRGKAK